MDQSLSISCTLSKTINYAMQQNYSKRHKYLLKAVAHCTLHIHIVSSFTINNRLKPVFLCCDGAVRV